VPAREVRPLGNGLRVEGEVADEGAVLVQGIEVDVVEVLRGGEVLSNLGELVQVAGADVSVVVIIQEETKPALNLQTCGRGGHGRRHRSEVRALLQRSGVGGRPR
jgi:hypothetical protein